MAIDYGTQRIGLAISDESGTIAFSREAIQRRATGWSEVLGQIQQHIDHWEIHELVVGMPLRLNATRGQAARRVEAFVEQLNQRLSIPIVLWDERLTTVAADRALIEGGVRRARRRQVVDSMAATLLLQSYLDSRNQAKCHPSHEAHLAGAEHPSDDAP